MPLPAIALLNIGAVLFSGALQATGAVVNCYALHHCGKHKRAANVSPEPIMAKIERQAGLCGVPQYNFDMCHDALRSVVVQTSIPAPGVAQFDNVPPTCMVLATVLLGGCGISGPEPIPCGSACLSYSGVTDDQMAQLSQALSPYAV